MITCLADAAAGVKGVLSVCRCQGLIHVVVSAAG